MAQTVTNASPASITIPYATSSSTYSNSSVSWSKPGAVYKMTALQLAFTTASSGYYVYVMHTVNGSSVGIGTYSSSAAAGEQLITLPENCWKDADGDSLTLRFRRPASNAQTYSSIRLIVTYESTAIASTAAAMDAVAGDPQTVNITNTDSTVCHVVTWQYGSVSGSAFTSQVSSGAQTFGAATRSPAWAVPSASLSALYSANPGRTTIPGRITVETFSEATSLGSVTVESELTIPNDNSTKPTLSVSMSAAQDAIGESAAVDSDYIQNHTTLSVTPTAAGQAGASVASIRIETPDGAIAATSGTASSFLLRTAGSYPVTVTATDSRGYTSVWATTLTVAECAAPVITALTAVRCDQNGTANDEGAYVSVAAAASVTSLADVDGWTYQLRQTGSSTVLEEDTLPGGADVIGGELDTDSTYIVTVTVTDTLGQTATASENIGSAIYTIHRMAGGKGVAFGKVSDKYGVEVSEEWPLYTHGMEIMQLIVDMAHPVGSVIQTADASWNPNVVWPWTTWVLLKDVFLRASGSQDVLATGGAASAQVPGHTLTVQGASLEIKPQNLPRYTTLAGSTSGTGYNKNSLPTGFPSYLERNHGNVAGFNYLITNDDAEPLTIDTQTFTIDAATVNTLPPYLVVNVWVRVRNPGDALPAGTLSGIIGGVSMSGGAGGDGYSSLLAVFARNIGIMEGEIQRVDEERADMLSQFGELVKYSDLTEEYSASVIGGRLNGPNLITTQSFWKSGSQAIVYGNATRCYGSSRPFVRSISADNEYTYTTEPADMGDSCYTTTAEGVTTWHVFKDEDEIRTSRVDLGASGAVTDESGVSYRYALQFSVTGAASGYHNSEDLVFCYGTDGGTATREVDDGNGGTTTETYTYPPSGILDMEDGETYTASCWARITSGTHARLVFKYGQRASGYVLGYEGQNQGSAEISTADGYGSWKRVEWTFVYHSTDHAGNAGGWEKRVSFGVCRKYTATVQLCGFRLVKGLNNWVEEQNRKLQAGIDALEARVEALEE